MKKLLSLALLLAVVLPASASDWQTGTVTNPGAGAVVVDTGALPADGNYKWCVWAAASVTAVLRIQHRDTSNATTLHEFYVPVSATTPAPVFCAPENMGPLLLQDERIRVINNSIVVGVVSASIIRSEP